MSEISDISRLVLPEDADVLDAAGIYGSFSQSADSLTIPRYASATARDAANATAGRVAGQMCAIEDAAGDVQLQQYDGSAWQTQEDIQYVIKPSSTTRVSDATSSADPHLTTTLLPNSEYMIDAHLSFGCQASGVNARATWSATGSPTVKVWAYTHPGSNGAGNLENGMIRLSGFSLGVETIITIHASVNYASYSRQFLHIVTGASSSVLTLLWAQGVSNATGTLLAHSSHMEVRRIG